MPDLIVVDLPEGEGKGGEGEAAHVGRLQVCRTLRQQPLNRHVPIVIIAPSNAVAAALTEIENGADDFLMKPFRPGELAARARAAIHRSRASRMRQNGAASPAAAPPAVTHGDIQVDPARRHVRIKNRRVTLTEQEFHLLYVLAAHAGVVFSRDGLLSQIWGDDRFVTVRSVDTLVSRLRRRIEPDDGDNPRYVLTVRGVGYKLETSDMKRFTALGLALVLMAAAAACGGADSSSNIVTPTGTVVTDTFTGTVLSPSPGSASRHS